MVAQIANWMRSHLLASVTSALVVGGGGAWAIMTSLEETRTNRLEERMQDEYVKIQESNQAVTLGLDRLSVQLATNNETDPGIVSSLSADFVTLYTALDGMKRGLDEESRAKLEAWQSALTDLKVETQRARNRADLQYISFRFLESGRASEQAMPVLEQRIGMPILRTSGVM